MKRFINYIQNAKSDMTNRVIQDPELRTAANKYIEAQTQFAHMLVDNTEAMLKYTFNNMQKGTKNDTQKSL